MSKNRMQKMQKPPPVLDTLGFCTFCISILRIAKLILTPIHHGGGMGMRSSSPRVVDLTQVPPVPWAWVSEHVFAAIRGCSVKVLQRERQMNIGCPFRRINGTTVRYKFGDITAFMESQPAG